MESNEQRMVQGRRVRRMKAAFSLALACYFTAVAALAGWYGYDVWRLQHVLLIVLTPGVIGVVMFLPSAVRTSMLWPCLFNLVVGPLACVVTFGGAGLLVAWSMTAFVPKIESPLIRSAMSATCVLVTLIAVGLFYRPEGRHQGQSSKPVPDEVP